MRTISIDGTASMISSASSRLELASVRRSWRRCAAPRSTACDDARVAVAEDQRPPRADVVEVAVAVDVEEVRPLAAGDEQRLAADGAERAGRAVDAAGDELAGTGEGGGTLGAIGHRRESCEGCAACRFAFAGFVADAKRQAWISIGTACFKLSHCPPFFELATHCVMKFMPSTPSATLG